jgi:hypothetical protein
MVAASPSHPYKFPFASNVSPVNSPPGTVCRILNLGCAQAVDINVAASAAIVKDRRKREGKRVGRMASYLVANSDRETAQTVRGAPLYHDFAPKPAASAV